MNVLFSDRSVCITDKLKKFCDIILKDQLEAVCTKGSLHKVKRAIAWENIT